MSVENQNISVVLLVDNESDLSTVRDILTQRDEGSNYLVYESILFQKRILEFQKYKLFIFQTPEALDADLSQVDAVKQAGDDMSRLLDHLTKIGLNSEIRFLFVLNIHKRFTIQDQLRMEIYETMFGENAFWESCIITFTGGEFFKTDFSKWMKEQRGPFKKVMDKCENRLVLLNKKENHGNNLKKSRDDLLSKIIGFYENKKPLGLFKNQQSFKKLVLRTEITTTDLKRTYYEALKSLYLHKDFISIGKLKADIHEKDNGTGLLKDILEMNERNIYKEHNSYCQIM